MLQWGHEQSLHLNGLTICWEATLQYSNMQSWCMTNSSTSSLEDTKLRVLEHPLRLGSTMCTFNTVVQQLQGIQNPNTIHLDWSFSIIACSAPSWAYIFGYEGWHLLGPCRREKHNDADWDMGSLKEHYQYTQAEDWLERVQGLGRFGNAPLDKFLQHIKNLGHYTALPKMYAHVKKHKQVRVLNMTSI